MRTDSTRVSNDALQAVRGHIQTGLRRHVSAGEAELLRLRQERQEAHEAIRPTDVAYTPRARRQLGLHGDQLRLYTLIYNRFVASQMTPAVFAVTNVEIEAARGAATGCSRPRAAS